MHLWTVFELKSNSWMLKPLYADPTNHNSKRAVKKMYLAL